MVIKTQDNTAFSSYLNNLQKFDQLTHEQVVELFQALEMGGINATRAKNRLAECNLRLVVSVAMTYKKSGMQLDDLIQEGNIGLLKAIDRFDWRKGFRFSTYAMWWIRQAIGQFVLKHKKIIRLPAHAATIQRRMLSAREEFVKEFGVEPSEQELTNIVGASETVSKATIYSTKGIVSLQENVKSRDDGNDQNTYENKIQTLEMRDDPFLVTCLKESKDIAKRILKELAPKESTILRLRFGLIEDDDSVENYQITEDELLSIQQGNGLSDAQ